MFRYGCRALSLYISNRDISFLDIFLDNTMLSATLKKKRKMLILDDSNFDQKLGYLNFLIYRSENRRRLD